MPWSDIETRREYQREYMKKRRAANPQLGKDEAKRRYAKNPEKMKEQGRLWHLNNPEKSKAQRKRWRDRNKDKRADQQLRAKYGITLEEKVRRIELQEGLCAICHTSINVNTGCMDHQHEPFRLREVLCGHCNKLIGFANEDSNILEIAAGYLIRHRFSNR
jgi:hypothetical protein